MLNKIIYTLLGIALAVAFFPHLARDSARTPVVAGNSTVSSIAADITAAPEMAVNRSVPDLTAKAALAYDLSSGAILYSNNLDEKLPIASLTKLMTALTVVSSVDLRSEVTVQKEDQTPIGSTIGLVVGEKIKVSDLLKAMLIPSGNDAALALADFVAGSPEKFAAMMNQQAANLNLANTHFSNPVGWDRYDKQENYSNSLDLIKIVQEFLKYDFLRKIVATRVTSITSSDGKYSHELHSTNKLLLDDPQVAGIKTGFTSKALGNLIVLVNHSGHEIVTIVLGSDNRETDTQDLLDWVFAVYKW
ncbi:MAG: serine hydrolase [Candidatus Doudnabacteria bacterium]